MRKDVVGWQVSSQDSRPCYGSQWHRSESQEIGNSLAHFHFVFESIKFVFFLNVLFLFGFQSFDMLLQVTEHDCPHLLFYGPSGAGKKTLIMALLRQMFGTGAEKVCLFKPFLCFTDYFYKEVYLNFQLLLVCSPENAIIVWAPKV